MDDTLVTHRYEPGPPSGKLKLSRDAQARVSWEVSVEGDCPVGLLDPLITEAVRADAKLREEFPR